MTDLRKKPSQVLAFSDFHHTPNCPMELSYLHLRQAESLI